MEYIERGTYWKHRNDLANRLGPGEERRKLKPRKLTVTPQYRVEDFYIPPFKQQRVFAPNGTFSYVALEEKHVRTGLDLFDRYIRYLASGGMSTSDFARKFGAKAEDFSSVVFLLTGMHLADFRFAYQVRMADELLRYTDMPLDEVARRSGFGTQLNLYYGIKRQFDTSPGRHRRFARGTYDLGRYK